MNKSIKSVLLVVGIALLAYGIYMLVSPEASVELGPLSVKAQDNNNAYITIGLGLVALLVGLLAGKK